MNLLLDTNVYIDFLGRRPPFFEPACKVIAAGFFGDAKLWLPAHSANDAFYVLSRYQKAETVQRAMLESFEERAVLRTRILPQKMPTAA